MALKNMRKFHFMFHALAYNTAWIVGILLAASGQAWTSTVVVLLLVALQYYWQFYIYQQSRGLNELVILLTTVGTCIDTALLHAGLIIFTANPFAPYLCPPWMIALWISFAVILYATLSNLFKHLRLLALLSFLGFSLAYVAGARMGAAFFPRGYLTAILIGFIWMLLMPTIIYYYNKIEGTAC